MNDATKEVGEDVSKYFTTVSWDEILGASREISQRLGGKGPTKTISDRSRFFLAPESWTIKAYAVSPSSTYVGLILWQQYRFNRGDQPLKLTGHMRRKFGLARTQVRRAVNALEKAGLITVQRFKHRSPLITIVGVNGGRNKPGDQAGGKDFGYGV